MSKFNEVTVNQTPEGYTLSHGGVHMFLNKTFVIQGTATDIAPEYAMPLYKKLEDKQLELQQAFLAAKNGKLCKDYIVL